MSSEEENENSQKQENSQNHENEEDENEEEEEEIEEEIEEEEEVESKDENHDEENKKENEHEKEEEIQNDNQESAEEEEEEENNLKLSLELIRKFKEISIDEPEQNIIDFVKSKGLPTKVKKKESLSLILYIHKICVAFYEILENLHTEEVEKIFLEKLKESYYLFADEECKHFNFENLAEKILPDLKVSQEKSDINIIFNTENLSNPLPQSEENILIKKKIIELGLESHGRLDIYAKIHILKSLISYINNPNLLPYSKGFQNIENDLIKLYNKSQKDKFTEEKYEQAVKLFANGEKRDLWTDEITKYKKSLGCFQNVNDLESIKILEKLFIQLLGHFDREIRNEATKTLNLIYDQTTWQDKSAFPLENTKINLLGTELNLELTLNDSSDFAENSIMLVVSSPAKNKNINYTVETFLKMKKYNEENGKLKVLFELGKLTKCGYYDWYLVRFSNGRFMNLKIFSELNETTDGKGRTIILNKDIKELSAHEVFCDLINAQLDKNQGRIVKRGNFKSLENKLNEFHDRFINCLYIMGALERDNDIAYDEGTGKPIDIANTEASPMAIINRSSISSLLGGEIDFKSLVQKAKSLNIKIIIDSLSRISSSRANRKYRNILLRYLDHHGKTQICYGCDGKSVRYEDSAILNYRKLASWEMLITEVKELINKFDIDGLHLDNCHTWPQIMELDASEMYRMDNDGQPAYSPMEILNGEIVLPNTESGYWDCDSCDYYANPLLIKLTKSIWNDHPNFIFIGECWLNEKYSQRHVSLSKSGVIPRMYTLPIIICQMLGKKILRDGKMETVPPENVSIIKDWYKENYQSLPYGAMLVQSSSGQVWPYPALLYGIGNWSAIDLLFSLPDIPMTFMGEIDGEAYRVQITNVYEKKDLQDPQESSTDTSSLKSRSKSLMKLIETKQQEQRERDRDPKSMVRVGSKAVLNDYLPQYDLNESISSLINLSGVNVKQAGDIDSKQKKLEQSLKKQDQEFDLSKIKYRYDHLREMRNKHKCLRNGELIYLSAYDKDNKVHPGIFAFARQTPEETGIFAINFRNTETNFLLDLSGLLGEKNNFNTICEIEDWTKDSPGEYYFLRELILTHVIRKIGPYSTVCFGFSIVTFSQQNYLKTMERSNTRLISDMKGNENNSLDCYQISIQLKEILDKKLHVEEFGNWMTYVLDLFQKYNVNFNDYIKRLEFLTTKEKYSTDFFRYCLVLKNLKTIPKLLKPAEVAEKTFNDNLLGPICFVTPELGRWSTIGGLGVMVDELSQGLNELGQEVIMISPYYNQNRKGKTDYLADDPFNIKYTKNVSIQLDNNYQFGVHFGTGNNGIKYYFLHNAAIFPKPYPDLRPADIVREMACFGKASLQLLCDIGILPAIIVTNDWFTGFTPAYAKCGAFGNAFKGTTFIHICHNLEPSYEGRLYPSPQEGTLEGIYQFNPDWVIDPLWSKKIINPSRCAIMMSDQWSTVSNSYKQELQTGSPLAWLLNQKKQPFAYPNGIFKEKRLKQLLEKAGGDRTQCKRYIQQKYFGYQDLELSVPVYSFVGRLTQQKGVLLILDSVEQLVRKTNGKINILVGGMGNPSDPYVAACISKINYLRGKYPNSFWANPKEFFTDGPKINLGSDFGLMPSAFEPGGIVQHEFFIAGTPVIAFKTGGLKDTVFEYKYDTNTGNGFTFEKYTVGELVSAIYRSLNLFQNKEHYENCRKNAKNSAIDVAEVSRAWCKEFFRLKDKVFFNLKDAKIGLDAKLLTPRKASRKTSAKVKKGKKRLSKKSKEENFHDKNIVDLEQEIGNDMEILSQSVSVVSNRPELSDGKIPMTFNYVFEKRNQPKNVDLLGSFDGWKIKHPLIFDALKNKWSVTLKLEKGKYLYKYVVNNEWVVNPNEKIEKGKDGIINNVCEI